MIKFNTNRLDEGSFKYLAAKESGYHKGDLPPFTVADVDIYLPNFLTERLQNFTAKTTHGYNGSPYQPVLSQLLPMHFMHSQKKKMQCASCHRSIMFFTVFLII